MCCYCATPFQDNQVIIQEHPMLQATQTPSSMDNPRKHAWTQFNFIYNHSEVPLPQRSATKWILSSEGERGWWRLECCGFLPNFSPQPHEGKSIVFRKRHIVFFDDMEGGVPSSLTSLAVWETLGIFANGLNEIRRAWLSCHIAFIQPFLQNSYSVEKVPPATRDHISSITLWENPFDSISCLSYNRDFFTKPSPSFLYWLPDTVTSQYN